MKQTPFLNQPRYGLIGHRGVASHAPENTLSGIRLAHQMGLNWIEIDVQQAKQSEPIIFHDATLERNTNGQGEVIAYDVKTLKTLDNGAWFSPQYRGETIPTLEEALICIGDLELTVNLEIKCPSQTPLSQIQIFAEKIASRIKQHWPDHLPQPLVSSFNLNFLYTYRKRSPDQPIGLLTDRLNDEVIQLVKRIPRCSLHCGQRHLDSSIIRSIAEQEILLLVYTVNDNKLGLALLEAGAFALFTDSPPIYLNL